MAQPDFKSIAMTSTCTGCQQTAQCAKILGKAPSEKISKFYYKKRAEFFNDDIKCCAQKRLG